MARDQVWLGANQIQDDMNKVLLPETVFKLGIADTEAALFWAYDAENEAVVISRLQDELTHKGRFETIGDSTVSEDRVVAVPQQVMSQYPEFESGERLHFVTISNQAEKDRCLVLPTELAQDRFDDAVDGLVSGGEE